MPVSRGTARGTRERTGHVPLSGSTQTGVGLGDGALGQHGRGDDRRPEQRDPKVLWHVPRILGGPVGV
jgi:hypothetical protein